MFLYWLIFCCCSVFFLYFFVLCIHDGYEYILYVQWNYIQTVFHIYTVFRCVERIETDLYVIYICCRRYKLRSNLNAYQHWMKLKSRMEETRQQQKQPKPKNYWRWEKEKRPILSSSSIHPENNKFIVTQGSKYSKSEHWHCQLLVERKIFL